MSSPHHPYPTPPAWSIIGLTSSLPILLAIIILGLVNISPFSANVIGLTYCLFISLSCTFVILTTHYPRRPNANPRFANFLLRTARWLGVINSGSGSRTSQMSENTRERLRVAGGGVIRASASVGSTETTLPPYSPRRPERIALGPFGNAEEGWDPRAFVVEERREEEAEWEGQREVGPGGRGAIYYA
ncbi:hypothetical protein BGX38DRAFT_128200 [Terfezia claveryi]|nr:hypothetical protein BGX38DRAFT_128200 [Terfezia claveryi]